PPASSRRPIVEWGSAVPGFPTVQIVGPGPEMQWQRTGRVKEPASNHWAAGPLVAATLPSFDFTIRPMMSVQAKNKSRGLLMVNSAPFSVFTAVPIASRHGFAVGFRL